MTTMQPRRRNGQFDHAPAPVPTPAHVPTAPTPPAPHPSVSLHAAASTLRHRDPDPQLLEWEQHAYVDALVNAVWQAHPVDAEFLAGSRHVRVRAALARTSRLRAVHVMLLRDRASAVLEQLARNPEVPGDLLDELAHRTLNTRILQLLIANPRTTPGTLEYLAGHRLPGIAEPARARLTRDAA